MLPLTHSCSSNGVIQLGPLGSDAMFEVAKISDACFVHLLLQSTKFKSGEFGGHSSGGMNSGISVSRNSTVAQAF